MSNPQKVLALDLSMSAGYCFLVNNGDVPTLLEFGVVKLENKVADYGTYPWNYKAMAKDMGRRIALIADTCKPDVIVIEETNGGRASRHIQKRA